MYCTKRPEAPLYPVAVNTDGLKEVLGCGYQTAVMIGNNAGAKITIGKRVIWNIKTIQEYLDKLEKEQNGGKVALAE